MKITVNGQELEMISSITLDELTEVLEFEGDVLLLNGYMANGKEQLSDEDDVVLIKKGVMPAENELEALMCGRHTPKIHHRLKKATVGIAGLGGLGSNIAVALARVGIGKIILVDYDVVEPSNLNRQAYEIADIGRLKSEALVEQLKRINPYNEYIGVNKKIEDGDVKTLFQDADVIVEAFDNPEYKAMIVNEVLLSMKQPIVCGSGMAGLYHPNEIKSKKVGERLFVCGDEVHEAKPFEGLMAPRVIIAAGHQATMVCRILLDEV